jgi:acyl-CoA thioesterase FadM
MSEPENKIGTYRFVAEPFHVDFNGRLTMGVLGNHLLNCAGFHATDRGFGIATLNEDNYTWVLSRLAVELDEMPYQYEEFSIQTWVENVYRLFTDRNFAIINKDGKKIGYARSIWAMINLSTRKPADLLTLHGGGIVDYVCQEPCPIEKPSRIKVDADVVVKATKVDGIYDKDPKKYVPAENNIDYINMIGLYKKIKEAGQLAQYPQLAQAEQKVENQVKEDFAGEYNSSAMLIEESKSNSYMREIVKEAFDVSDKFINSVKTQKEYLDY